MKCFSLARVIHTLFGFFENNNRQNQLALPPRQDAVVEDDTDDESLQDNAADKLVHICVPLSKESDRKRLSKRIKGLYEARVSDSGKFGLNKNYAIAQPLKGENNFAFCEYREVAGKKKEYLGIAICSFDIPKSKKTKVTIKIPLVLAMRGYGDGLMKSMLKCQHIVIKKIVAQKRIQQITYQLSALEEAVPFYETLDFERTGENDDDGLPKMQLIRKLK